MSRALKFCLYIMAALWVRTGFPEPRIAVVVHPECPYADITRHQVIDIYMGRMFSLLGNHIPLPLDQQGGSAIREHFYETLTERPLAEINAYWARLIFTGRAAPPRILPDSSSVLQVVSHNRDAIGYVEAEKADASVRVLFYLE